jgi:signal transduction histidine kinase
MICALDSVERAFDDYDVRLIEIFARYLAHEQSQRELENQLSRSNEMKMLGQLTSGVAHEVRNPLNGIMAIMGALSKELSDTGRFQPYLKHMQNQVNRLTTLMEELLALGRPIRDEKKENVSIVLLAQNAITSWQQSLQHGREVQLLISEDVKKDRMIRADSAKIEQMIINLLDNAQQHSEPDKQIILSLEASGFDRVHILVRDNGPGISPEILPRIFDPFFTTRKGGTGLGLSIVRHIAESHGGTITAYNNKDGSGATFEISLPFSQAVS